MRILTVSLEHIRVVLCNNSNVLQKTANIRKNESNFDFLAKNGHNAKAIAHAKWLSLGQEIKIALKHANINVSTNTLELFYAKKTAPKNS